MFRGTAKCNVDRWITRVISTSAGINRVRLACHISSLSEHGDLSFLLSETVRGREHSWKVSKKFIGNFYFWGITLKEFHSMSKFQLRTEPWLGGQNVSFMYLWPCRQSMNFKQKTILHLVSHGCSAFRSEPGWLDIQARQSISPKPEKPIGASGCTIYV